MVYKKSVQFFSKIYGYLLRSSVNPSNELIHACDYLGLKKDFPKEIVKATIVATLISIIPALALFFLFKAALFLLLPVVVNHFYSEHYKSKYYIQKVKDMGCLPDFFSVLITNLKINPNLENALINSSILDYGLSSKIAKKIMRKINSGVDLDTKDELSKEFKIFDDSKVDLCVNSIISAISVKNPVKRNILFSDALNQLLNSLKNNAELFSRSIYTSVLMIFAIGTIIPLILVSIFPLIGLISGKFMDIYSLFFFLIISVVVVAFIVEDLKKKSPSKFSQIIIKSRIKSFNSYLLFLIIFALSFPSILLSFEKFLGFALDIILRQYSPFFFFGSASIVLSINYYFKNRELIKEKRGVSRVEDSLIDSFMVIGARVNEGHSIESSIKYALDNSKGYLKDFFSKVYEKISKLGVELQEAFDFSIFSAKVFSKRIKSMVDLLCFTVKKHSVSSGEAMVEICNYYRKIKGVEFDMDNSLSKNTDMIKMTIYLFSPIVCALIINISGLINSFMSNDAGAIFFSFSSIDSELLSLLISCYLLILIVVLTGFYSFLKFGDDAVEYEFELSKSLFMAFLVFTATLIISKIFLFKL